MLLSATRIHDGKHWLPEGTIIELSDNGTVTALHNAGIKEEVKHYDGIICPGFVNTHCHLELSHMKGAIPEHTGLVPFLKQVATTRNDHTEEQKIEARHTAFKAMQANGVVAVGDIANTSDTLDLRVQNKMHFHSFVEALGFTETPQRQFDYATAVYHAFDAQQQEGKILRQSIVPHAPYSVSQQLFSLIDKFDEQSVLSIHNQECHAEDEYYLTKKGAINELLESIGIDDSFFIPSGKTSIQTYLQWLSATHPFVFIHNTYTNRADIDIAQTLLKKAYWCLCPNANKYIENTLPDIPMLMEECDTICIGTDSLSSNHQLSILAELQTIKERYPETEWETLLRWGTYNGALALQMDEVVGGIAVGKQPGLVVIKDLETNPQISVVIV
ncbi:MAG: amidohydrolase family protein [Chitinophagales bacterium]|nr:amidohydrolase family protein [Chitinophagaceae bacterium]MCB9065410.1 amidohydrolase family protein [Chitinophagales bacterium]